MEEEDQPERHFIGFDFSTQQIKAVVVNSGLEVTTETHVHFDSMLPEYRTSGGVHSAGRVVTAPTIMWVKALDMLLDKLRVAGLDFTTVGVLSFCAFNCGDVVCFLIFASNCEPRFEKETVTLLSIALSP